MDIDTLSKLLNDFGPWMLGYIGCAYLLWVNRIQNKELLEVAKECSTSMERFSVKLDLVEREISRMD